MEVLYTGEKNRRWFMSTGIKFLSPTVLCHDLALHLNVAPWLKVQPVVCPYTQHCGQTCELQQMAYTESVL